MAGWLADRGRRLLGWDEILEGGLAPGATVMSWRGIDGGVAAATAGHDVVMSPNTHCYFDCYQARDTAAEPPAIGGHLPLEQVYAFEPVAPALAGHAAHVLGVQGNIWTEYIATDSPVQYMAFPRALALAEVAWTPAELRSPADFRDRLPRTGRGSTAWACTTGPGRSRAVAARTAHARAGSRHRCPARAVALSGCGGPHLRAPYPATAAGD